MNLELGIKYACDRLAACVLLVLLSPLLALVAIAIRLDSPGNPFFVQERIGASGRPFKIFKYRTMRAGSEKLGLGATTKSDDDRITRVGRWLRATSLDEVPQLLNIARGEMSFIGPRPTLRYQVENYTARQQRRLRMRPGITGWAQVHGRNEIPWERRIELDLEYIDNFCLLLDTEILLRTARVLVRREGVYARDRANDAFVTPVAEADATPRVQPAQRSEPAPRVPSTPRVEPVSRAAASPPAVEARPVLLPLLVVGAGGHARVVVDIAEKQGRFRVVGLVDERPELAGSALLGYPVLGGREVLERGDLPSHAVVAIGSPAARAAWQALLEERGFQLAVLVHPSAQVGRETVIGGGSVLMAGAIVNSGSRLGRGVIVNTAASVDHDCEVGDFVHVAPGARLAGGVRVGARAHIGIGACVLQNLQIGADAIVGGGAAVIRPVAAGTTVVGVPAEPRRSRQPEPDVVVIRP